MLRDKIRSRNESPSFDRDKSLSASRAEVINGGTSAQPIYKCPPEPINGVRLQTAGVGYMEQNAEIWSEQYSRFRLGVAI